MQYITNIMCIQGSRLRHSIRIFFGGGGGGIRSGMVHGKRSHWTCLNPFLVMDSYTYLFLPFKSNNDNAKTPLTSDDAGPRQRCV